jgi:hypothetical protein
MELIVDRAQDVRPARRMPASTVLHVEFGLEAELIDAGVLHPVTKVSSAVKLQQRSLFLTHWSLPPPVC